MINLVFAPHMIFNVFKFTGYTNKITRSEKNEGFYTQRLMTIIDDFNT